MNDSEKALTGYISASSQMIQTINTRSRLQWISMPTFVGALGRLWPTGGERPEHLKPGEPKNCYGNAAQAALSFPELTYVEGYATGIIPVEHAWCVDESGKVVDTTWDDSQQCAYYGVPFRTDWLRKFLIEKTTYGVIDDWERGYPLLRGDYTVEEFLKKTTFENTSPNPMAFENR